jgi:hypothetical protein
MLPPEAAVVVVILVTAVVVRTGTSCFLQPVIITIEIIAENKRLILIIFFIIRFISLYMSLTENDQSIGIFKHVKVLKSET